jgi:hypothetical protein
MHLHYKNKFKKYNDILWESFIFACQNGNAKKHLSHDVLCPICRENEETTIHILRCSDFTSVLRQYFCTMLNKKLKGKTDEYKIIINDIHESIIDKPTGSLQGINWEMQQYLGWDYCIRGFLSTKWLEISRFMNLEKPDAVMENME